MIIIIPQPICLHPHHGPWSTFDIICITTIALAILYAITILIKILIEEIHENKKDKS